MPKRLRLLLFVVLGVVSALTFLPTVSGFAQANTWTNPTACQFQPMAVDRTATVDNIRRFASGGGNISWDETYVGLHRWNAKQWPAVDYLVKTTLPFKNGGVVSWVGTDGAGGGNSIIIDGTGNCQGWRVFYGHLNYNAASKFEVDQKVGPNEVIGQPGCSGFESNCDTEGDKIPKHNHVALGYWSNIFDFGDETEVAFVKGYWWIHPARVESSPAKSSKQFQTASQEIETPSPNELSATEFVLDDIPVAPASLNTQNFAEEFLITFLPFRNVLVIGLALLAITWIGGMLYSAEFRKSMFVFSSLAVLVLVFFIGVNKVKANSAVFSPPREAEFVIDLQEEDLGWTIDLNTNDPAIDTVVSEVPSEETPIGVASTKQASVAVPSVEETSVEDPAGEEIVLETTSQETNTEDPNQEKVKKAKDPSSGECSLPNSYPEKILRWCDLIEKYAVKNGLEPRLIAAVMLQESGGKPEAYSSAGATGLLQVMPSDGISASFHNSNGVPYFADRPTIAELEDPEFNIRYGSKMLGGLIAKYGNIRDGLLHYGPSDVGYYYADIVPNIYENYR